MKFFIAVTFVIAIAVAIYAAIQPSKWRDNASRFVGKHGIKFFAVLFVLLFLFWLKANLPPIAIF